MVEIVCNKSSFTVNVIDDLKNLKIFMEVNKLGKPNFAKIARTLEVDYRTVKKYYYGFEKSKKRNKSSKIDKYYGIIKGLLVEDKSNLAHFNYIDHLYRYLTREHGLNTCRSNFYQYICSKKEFRKYFSNNQSSSSTMTEKAFGKQAQFDWKEKIKFTYENGEKQIIHIASLVLSASGKKVQKPYPSMSQDCLLDFLSYAFEVLGAVPHELVIDNAKTMMDIPRTKFSSGKVNARFQQFADDYNFKVKPCVAGRPKTKSKVENRMKIVDEILSYNGNLKDFLAVTEKTYQICAESNVRINQKTKLPPNLVYVREKEHMQKLPPPNICSNYKIYDKKVIVNSNSLFTYQSNYYSVPTKYIGKIINVCVYDKALYVYSNKNLIVVHPLSNGKINYIKEHHQELTSLMFPYKEKEDIQKQSLDNLKQLEVYNEQLSAVRTEFR